MSAFERHTTAAEDRVPWLQLVAYGMGGLIPVALFNIAGQLMGLLGNISLGLSAFWLGTIMIIPQAVGRAFRPDHRPPLRQHADPLGPATPLHSHRRHCRGAELCCHVVGAAGRVDSRHLPNRRRLQLVPTLHTSWSDCSCSSPRALSSRFRTAHSAWKCRTTTTNEPACSAPRASSATSLRWARRG